MDNVKCIRCNKVKIPWRDRWPGDSLTGYVKYTKYIKNGMFRINLNEDVCEDCAMVIYDGIKGFMANI